jgi:WXXGXW repeat (2 copies)
MHPKDQGRKGGYMRLKLAALALLAGSSLFAQTHFYVGARIGYRSPAPVVVYAPPPAPLVTYASPYPGPGYSWVAGYWYPVGRRYEWRAGYWTRPAFYGARWVAPRYVGRRYYGGYWRR